MPSFCTSSHAKEQGIKIIRQNMTIAQQEITIKGLKVDLKKAQWDVEFVEDEKDAILSELNALKEKPTELDLETEKIFREKHVEPVLKENQGLE